MRGFVLHEKGNAGWAEVPEPEIGPYDAITRVTAAATCTTDVHMIATAAFPALIGKVLGHEAVGVVEQVGELVTGFQPGDRVVIPTGYSDWRNPRAQRGEAKYYQTNSPYYSPDPSIAGTFSERVRTLDADLNLAHIPDAVTDIQAVLVGDMVATGFTGVERMESAFGETVAVIGVGPVGLMGVAGAALRGAGRIIAVGSRPATLDLARRYGATDVVDYKSGPILDQVLAANGGQPVDAVLIASGGSASAMLTTALRLVKPGGHVANVAGFLSEETVTIPLSVWDYGFKERFLTGVFVKDGRDWIERLLTLIAVGRLDTAPMATHILHGWDALEDGIALMRDRNPDVIKPVIVID
jgi:threonine dehydrogenase-like Zn-dependent dehydrogenase